MASSSFAIFSDNSSKVDADVHSDLSFRITIISLASIGIGSVGTSELPVLPTTFSTSGNFSNSILAPCEIAVIEVCKLLPGKTRVSTAKSPSSNDGINSPPINESVMIAKTNNVNVVPIITLGIANAFSKIG